MAISVTRSLAQLKKECASLGLEVRQSGKRESKTDYILALRQYHLDHDFPNGVPKSLDLILNIESPMLCSRISEFSEEEQESLWNSESYIAEQKADGARMNMVFTSEGWDFYSRNISVKNYLPISYKDNIYLGTVSGTPKHDMILDAEVVCTNPHINTIMGNKGVITESQLQAVTAIMAMNSTDSIRIQKEEDCPLEFEVFDILYLDGQWLVDKPLIERMEILDPIVKELQAMGYNVKRLPSTYHNKKAFYKTMLSLGNEGVILKNIYSPYRATNTRRKDGFIKVKRSMTQSSQMFGLADTIDGFVTGFEPADENKSWKGLVGALEFSVYLRDADGNQKLHKIARITNITLDLRRQLTEVDANGNPTLKKEWYGRVASLDGQCVSARSNRLKHAVLVDWRPDRSEDTCIMDESFLHSMVL